MRARERGESMSRPVAGAAVVCLKGDCVLLAQRAQEPNRGRWSYPGGKIEPGETARQAAAREADEETGVRVTVLDVVDVYDAIFPPFHYCVADYLAVPIDDAEPRPGADAMDARWVSFSEIGEYDLTEAMERVLARARWLLSVRDDGPPPLGLDLDSVPPSGVGAATSLREAVEGLYFITDETVAPGRTHVDLARAALAGGARVIQLRDKRRDAGELLPIALEIRDLCREAGAVFVVNDRVDLALAAGADGVHLGQTDLSVDVARRLMGPDRLIGVSVEGPDQAQAAEACGADYLGVGAIYGSANKADAGAAVGVEQIRRMRAVSRLPVVAIGGITLDRIDEVRRAGASSVAVIGAIATAPEPEAAARALAEACAR
jgi:thiamine-phosphate pyrophosphorylase